MPSPHASCSTTKKAEEEGVLNEQQGHNKIGATSTQINSGSPEVISPSTRLDGSPSQSPSSSENTDDLGKVAPLPLSTSEAATLILLGVDTPTDVDQSLSPAGPSTLLVTEMTFAPQAGADSKAERNPLPSFLNASPVKSKTTLLASNTGEANKNPIVGVSKFVPTSCRTIS